MANLLDLQCEMRDALLASQLDAPAGNVLTGIAGPDAAECLDIYRSTIHGALVKAMRLTYPAVKRLVGEAFFDWASALYALAHPATQADLNRYGQGFPGFLAGLPACATVPYLPDVARLDAAVAKALHADDAPVLLAHELVRFSASADRLSFDWHPAATLLASRFPVHAIWRAVLAGDDEALGCIEMEGEPEHLLVCRTADGPQVLVLAPGHWQFIDALFSGQPLGDAVAGSAIARQEAGTWLAAHLAAGRIVGFRLHEKEGA
jgi:hypothetical protein